MSFESRAIANSDAVLSTPFSTRFSPSTTGEIEITPPAIHDKLRAAIAARKAIQLFADLQLTVARRAGQRYKVSHDALFPFGFD